MKIILKIGVFFLFFTAVNAQKKHEFIGAIKLNGNDKAVITYSLVLFENEGKLSGYSVTDLGGVHETKNTILGIYDIRTKKIEFKEDAVLYTKSPLSASTFCFVNFAGKINLNKESGVLEGIFKGLYKNQQKCIDGTLQLMASNKLDKILAKVDKMIKNSKKIDEKTKNKFNPIKVVDSLKVNNLLKNQNLTVFTRFKTVDLTLWDSGANDDDVINLYHNEVLILKEYHLVNKKKEIKASVNQGSNVFKIEAINEGRLGSNTATIQVGDEDRTFDLVSNLKKGESASITIIRQEN